MRSALEFCKCDRTAHLAIAILDHACRLQPEAPEGFENIGGGGGGDGDGGAGGGGGSWAELLGIASLLLACKFQEVEIHMVDEFVYFAEQRYGPSDVLDAETAICSLLQLDLAIPTSLDFLFCLLQRLRWPRLFAVHRGLHTQAVMLAQLLCELSLLSPPLAHCPRASLVASCALCLSLACLRCGVWRDGSPGPSASPEQYWTASMAQATGYGRHDLRELMGHLRSIHEEAAAELASDPIGAHANDHWGGGFSGKFGVLRHKYSQPRFLGVLKVPPFTPHSGGSLYSPIAQHVVRAPTSSPLAAPAAIAAAELPEWALQQM